MRLITTAAFAIAAFASASVPALAGDRASDATYLKAARCQGLAHAVQLGASDTSSIDAFVKAQGERRDGRMRNQARTIRADAEREAQSEARRARLIAERDQRCAAFMGDTQVASNAQTAR